MTMVPAPKLSKPHLIFYGGCGAASPEVMSRFGDGCSSGGGAGAGAGGGGGYNNINGNHHHDDATTTADNIITNKVDKSSNNNNNKVISSVLGSDLGIGHPHHHHPNINIVMADEQQQQHSRNSNNSVNDDDGGDGSSGVIRQRSNSVAKTREDDDVMDSSSWLQLGLGGGGGTHLGSSSPHQVESTAPRTTAGGLMLELNLGGGFHHHHRHNHNHNQTTPFQMPGLDSRVPQTPPHGSLGGGSVSGPTTFVSPHHQILISSLSPQSQLYLLHQQQQQQQQLQLQLQQQQLGWGLMNQRTTMSASMSPSSSSSLPPQQVLLPAAQSGIPPFFTRPFTSSGASVDDAPDSEFRLIHPPPRRPHSGIWFSLHASLHQSKEPFLPQVSKNFLRIKDGRMTVRLVMKYLANKLGLDNESEVEIRCRGQQLVPFLTLQHVRDNIWSPREAAVTLLPDSSTSDHLMVLNYGRSTTSSAYNYLT